MCASGWERKPFTLLHCHSIGCDAQHNIAMTPTDETVQAHRAHPACASPCSHSLVAKHYFSVTRPAMLQFSCQCGYAARQPCKDAVLCSMTVASGGVRTAHMHIAARYRTFTCIASVQAYNHTSRCLLTHHCSICAVHHSWRVE